MKLLVVIFKDYRKMDELLLALIEIGVTGGTVIEGRGMGQIIGSEIPIFASLRGLFPGSATDSHLLICAVEDGLIEECFCKINAVMGSFDQPGTGIAFSLPIDHIVGLKPEIGTEDVQEKTSQAQTQE